MFRKALRKLTEPATHRSTCVQISAPVQVARDKLVSLGVQLGRLTTHTGKFRLGIGALDLLAQHAKYKVRRRSSLCSVHRSALHICIQWPRLRSQCLLVQTQDCEVEFASAALRTVHAI